MKKYDNIKGYNTLTEEQRELFGSLRLDTNIEDDKILSVKGIGTDRTLRVLVLDTNDELLHWEYKG